MKNPDQLYKKIATLNNLTDAIREVKKAMNSEESSSSDSSEIAKAEKSTQEEPKQHGLSYLGRKLSGGKITHLIGSGKDGDSHYQLEVDLHKHNKGLPSIMLMHVSPKGELLDQHSEQHKHLKSAIQALMQHHMKKAWKNG